MTNEIVVAGEKFHSNAGNVWEVLKVAGNKATVIRRAYYAGDECFFPVNETPYCFHVDSLAGMSRVDFARLPY